jgi:hypothetical protein
LTCRWRPPCLSRAALEIFTNGRWVRAEIDEPVETIEKHLHDYEGQMVKMEQKAKNCEFKVNRKKMEVESVRTPAIGSAHHRSPAARPLLPRCGGGGGTVARLVCCRPTLQYTLPRSDWLGAAHVLAPPALQRWKSCES